MNQLTAAQLIAGLVVVEDESNFDGPANVPRIRLSEVATRAERLFELGVGQCMLFVKGANKDPKCTEALRPDNLMVRAIRAIRARVPALGVLTEDCGCAYSSLGECIVVDARGKIDDAATHQLVGRMAVLHADNGATTIVAGLTHPGSVAAIRRALDTAGLASVDVVASLQFESALYRPYRSMMDTSPIRGTMARNHIDHRRAERAFELVAAYRREGAARIRIQPALSTMDVLARLSCDVEMPITAFSVSHELRLVCDRDMHLIHDFGPVLDEYFGALMRAGATDIMTYLADDYAAWLQEQAARTTGRRVSVASDQR